MKLLLLIMLIAGTSSVMAQSAVTSTLWADGLFNVQLPKSSFYGLGAGLRAEVARSSGASGEWFAQAGYGHFPRKPASAFTANLGLLSVGYRHQFRRAFNVSMAVGGQYWSEQMRLNLADGTINERFVRVAPSATVGIGFRIRSHYRLGLENRLLVKSQDNFVRLRNNLALSIGYRF